MNLFDEDYHKGSEKLKEASKEMVDAYKNYQRTMIEKSPFGSKMNELIFLSAACAIHCSYCIETHAARAKAAGATAEEIAMIIHMAASINHGATISYGVDALKD